MLILITLIMAFVFLHEQFTVKSIIGSILITAGTPGVGGTTSYLELVTVK